MISEDILIWANTLPNWQKLLIDKIIQGEKIDELILEDSYKTFKIENGLQAGVNDQKYAFTQISGQKVQETQVVKWRGVKDVQGINALSGEQRLTIGDGLTIIYGENGSGKSGYTRIFNKAFVSRGDKTLLSNIFLPAIKDQNADLIFEVNHNEEIVALTDSINNSYCKMISVFDTTSALNDMTNETELSLAPVEFTVFGELANYILKIKEKLESEKQLRSNNQDFADYFASNTKIKSIITAINGKTKLVEIENKVTILEEESEQFKAHTKRRAELLALNVDTKLRKLSELSQDISRLKSNILKLNGKFSNERLVKIQELINKYDRLKKLSSDEGVSQFKDENIENLGSEEWKDFILAAKTYHDSIKHEVGYCILCRQDILNVTILDKYWTYLKSDAEKQLKDVIKDIVKLGNDFDKLDELILLNNDSRLYEYLSQNNKELILEVQTFEDSVKKQSKKLSSCLSEKKYSAEIESISFNGEMWDKIEKQLSETAKNTNKTLVDDELRTLQKSLDEYNAKLVAQQLLPKISKYIEDLSWLDKARNCTISTTSITKKRTELFSKYVTDEYIEQFKLECEKLKLNIEIKADQRGSIGSTKNRLSIKNRKPIAVLSEGEQRVAAIANFLAEASVSVDNRCLIFDDPVSSLDHERRNVIAERLVELSKEKQVVVMTHNISLLLALETLAKKNEVICESRHIQKISDNAGILDETIPWIGMNMKSRVSALKNKLQTMTSEYNKKTTAQEVQKYNRDVEVWCTDLRMTWERGIEEKLFNGAVERYRPSIETQKLKNAPYTKELYEEIASGMSECSNWMHDRSPELGAIVPDPAELLEYVQHCEDFMKKINKLIK